MNIQDIIGKIKCCFSILTHKQYYAAIVVETYSDGSPFVTEIVTNVKDTQTARKKLIKALKEDVKVLRIKRRYNDQERFY